MSRINLCIGKQFIGKKLIPDLSPLLGRYNERFNLSAEPQRLDPSSTIAVAFSPAGQRVRPLA
jgi:hypothetical protein